MYRKIANFGCKHSSGLLDCLNPAQKKKSILVKFILTGLGTFLCVEVSEATRKKVDRQLMIPKRKCGGRI
jgi:hypothetical protein